MALTPLPRFAATTGHTEVVATLRVGAHHISAQGSLGKFQLSRKVARLPRLLRLPAGGAVRWSRQISRPRSVDQVEKYFGERAMRTVVIMLIGLGLLAAWLLVARSISKGRAETFRTAVLAFIAVWFVAAAINLGIGVSQAGYSFLEERPTFLVIFGIPAALAVFDGRRLR
jgi:hypothetical protein